MQECHVIPLNPQIRVSHIEKKSKKINNKKRNYIPYCSIMDLAAISKFELGIAIGIIVVTALIAYSTGILGSKSNTVDNNTILDYKSTIDEAFSETPKTSTTSKPKPKPRPEPATSPTPAPEIKSIPLNDSDNDAMSQPAEQDNANKSALRENIERKGKNAYYFAHSNTPTGPKWDGKAEPKLLHKASSSSLTSLQKQSFDYNKSNITSYAFIDEESKIKIYVNLEGVGKKCSTENGDIVLDHSESSMALTIKNYEADKERCLCFGKLFGKISAAKFRTKDDRILITLTKDKDDLKEWKSVGAA